MKDPRDALTGGARTLERPRTYSGTDKTLDALTKSGPPEGVYFVHLTRGYIAQWQTDHWETIAQHVIGLPPFSDKESQEKQAVGLTAFGALNPPAGGYGGNSGGGGGGVAPAPRQVGGPSVTQPMGGGTPKSDVQFSQLAAIQSGAAPKTLVAGVDQAVWSFVMPTFLASDGPNNVFIWDMTCAGGWDCTAGQSFTLTWKCNGVIFLTAGPFATGTIYHALPATGTGSVPAGLVSGGAIDIIARASGGNITVPAFSMLGVFAAWGVIDYV